MPHRSPLIALMPVLQQRLAKAPAAWRRRLPILDWGSRYSKAEFSNDLLAAVIVTIMLIPQSLAYALLAGLPAEVGLYASISDHSSRMPCFGTSRTLAVGPVAVISLVTASAIGTIAPAMQVHPVVAAILLAFLSGIMLIAMGVFRLGAIANFLSHPGHLWLHHGLRPHHRGEPAEAHPWHRRPMAKTSFTCLPQCGRAGRLRHDQLPDAPHRCQAQTAFLFWSRSGLQAALFLARGLSQRTAMVLSRAAPVAAVAATTW